VQYITCGPGGVRSGWSTGENDRILHENQSLKKKGNHTTHVSGNNGGMEGKDPEVQMEFLARGSALPGYPEHEEAEKSRRVE
jgi:hypothetical protein